MITKSESSIKDSLTSFIETHKNFNYEKGQSQPYWTNFFNCFGLSASDYSKWSENNSDGKYIDYRCPKYFLIEQKSKGKSLDEAFQQAMGYFQKINDEEKPRFVIVSDFKQFVVREIGKDFSIKNEYSFTHDDHDNKISLWIEIFGGEKTYREEFELTVRAGNIMADLHDSLKDSGYIEDLELLLVRLLFCLFADDIGIFDKDIFVEEIEKTTVDSLGGKLDTIFDLMNKPFEKRQTTISESLKKFPYVNGGLFDKRLSSVTFNDKMKDLLLEACKFDWTTVSPIVFGSIFQYAMNDEKRREFGAHFTTIENIKKTINPLFLNDLWIEYENIITTKTGDTQKSDLNRLLQKIGNIVIFDPACGSGNFLTVSYTELRILENTIIRKLYDDYLLVTTNVKIDNFYGVELEEFPSYVARVSMWLTEQQMYIDLAKRYGSFSAKLPLEDSAHIVHGNSLCIDWDKDVLKGKIPTYIIGNPPFVGKQQQTLAQKKDIELIFPKNPKSRSLDYVACWHKKASDFLKYSPKTEVAFVSTNSICQGEQTAILWKELFDMGVKINFAHQTFQWTSEMNSANTAKVYVIIVGFALFDRSDKKLFTYVKPTEVTNIVIEPVKTINGYLDDIIPISIDSRKTPISNIPPMIFGTMPIDNGNFLFTEEEKNKFLQQEPKSEKWFRDTIGAREFINNTPRYCLWLNDIKPNELNTMPLVKSRIEAVRQFRLASTDKGTREKLSQYPTRFRDDHTSTDKVIAVPGVSSENREYIPIDFAKENTVVLNSMLVIHSEEKWLFAILTSRMHMAWMRAVGGRLESRYRYSKDIVYNNFPFPILDDTKKAKLTELADDILNARAKYPDSSLADLYDKIAMPDTLRKAHNTLDNYVDKLYKKSEFKSDSERVEMLLLKYQELVNSDLLIKSEVKKTRKTKK